MGISTVSNNGAPAPLPQAPQGSSGSSAAAAVVSAQAESQAHAQKAAATAQQVQDAVQTVNKAFESKASDLQFSVDKQSGDTVVKVVDSSTGDVIRQIPTEEVLNIAHNIERMQGLLMRDKA
jgi:flagellar protein FlaG